MADVSVHRLRAWGGAGDLGFLELTFAGIGQQVIRIARTHDAGAGQRQRHARRVDGDPATTPLLGDVGGGAGTAGRVKHEVAGIGGHKMQRWTDRRWFGRHKLVRVAAQIDPSNSNVCPDIIDG